MERFIMFFHAVPQAAEKSFMLLKNNITINKINNKFLHILLFIYGI